MRKPLFGDDDSTEWADTTENRVFRHTTVWKIIIRDRERVESLFAEYGADIERIVNTAVQPSHAWVAWKPTDDLRRIVDEIFDSISARVEPVPFAVDARPHPVQFMVTHGPQSVDFKNLPITCGAGFVGSNLALLFREARRERPRHPHLDRRAQRNTEKHSDPNFLPAPEFPP
jgi:hypothetical protein